MFPLSHPSPPFVEQESESLDDSHISLEQKMRALEAEVNALQRLVCHLLERNECLRVRLRMS